MTVNHEPEQRSLPVRILLSGFGLLVACVTVMWAIELVDTFVLSDSLQRNGINPRRIEGLDGILWTPWLHSDFGHILSNTVPFIVLGWLTMIRGFRFWLAVTVGTMLGGGFLVWLLAGGSNHIGASGLVFGYFGALMGAAVRSRKPATLAPALVAIFLYGTILVGIVPQDDISWEGHLFGMIAGFVVAYRLVPARARSDEDEDPDDYLYPWELDEPWRSTDQ